MARRIGPGPVFIYESLIFARQRQVYVGRVLFVLAMLAGLWISWWDNGDAPGAWQSMRAGPRAGWRRARGAVPRPGRVPAPRLRRSNRGVRQPP